MLNFLTKRKTVPTQHQSSAPVEMVRVQISFSPNKSMLEKLQEMRPHGELTMFTHDKASYRKTESISLRLQISKELELKSSVDADGFPMDKCVDDLYLQFLKYQGLKEIGAIFDNAIKEAKA